MPFGQFGGSSGASADLADFFHHFPRKKKSKFHPENPSILPADNYAANCGIWCTEPRSPMIIHHFGCLQSIIFPDPNLAPSAPKTSHFRGLPGGTPPSRQPTSEPNPRLHEENPPRSPTARKKISVTPVAIFARSRAGFAHFWGNLNCHPWGTPHKP